MEHQSNNLNETILDTDLKIPEGQWKWKTSFSGERWGRVYILKHYDLRNKISLTFPGDGHYEIEIFDRNFHFEKSNSFVEFQREIVMVEKGQRVYFIIRVEETNHLPETYGCNDNESYSFIQCTKVIDFFLS